MGATALALILALQGAPEEDVVTLKDGGVRKGRILSETDAEIVLETVIKGSKGQVVGTAKQKILKAAVAKVERADPEARTRAAARAEAFAERGARRREALARLRPVPCEIDGLPAVRIEGAQFVLEAAVGVAFAKDVALSLEEILEAYRRFFEIRRNADRKLRVYLFADREQYARFQKRELGGAVLNPAYYHVKENYIAAFNSVQKEDERRIREDIVELEKQIEAWRGKVVDAQRQVDHLALTVRRDIQKAASEARVRIKSRRDPDLAAKLRQVDREEKALLDDLKRKEEAAQQELSEARKKADAAILLNRQVIERNERVLAAQSRAMFETLYHEGFHAFAANYLWEGSAKAEFPRWLHEGMACYFEMSAVQGGELLHGAPHPGLLKLYREKAAEGKLAALEDVLRGTGERFAVVHEKDADRSSVYYAQSWALAHYAAARLDRDRIAAYVNDVLGGRDPVAAFEKLMGMRCADVEREVGKHVQGLKAP